MYVRTLVALRCSSPPEKRKRKMLRVDERNANLAKCLINRPGMVPCGSLTRLLQLDTTKTDKMGQNKNAWSQMEMGKHTRPTIMYRKKVGDPPIGLDVTSCP